jgi:hypothetical protein
VKHFEPRTKGQPHSLMLFFIRVSSVSHPWLGIQKPSHGLTWIFTDSIREQRSMRQQPAP